MQTRTILIQAIISAIGLFTITAQAGDLYVSANGNDSSSGTEFAPFKTIAMAGSVATPGTTIHVAPGTYPGGFKTIKSGTAAARIRYVSVGKWGAKIVGTGSSYNWLNLGNYVTVEGFEISGASTTAGIVSGPWSGGDVGHHFIAHNNYIHDISVNKCGSSGAIHVFSLTGGSAITNNIIKNIAVSKMGNCTTMQGIYIAEPDTYVANNVVSGVAAVGIQQWHGATRSTIVNNTVFGSLEGFMIGSGDGGTLPNGSQNNYVANNIAFDNVKYGFVEAGKTSNNRYVNNLSYKNTPNWSVKGTVTGSITADPKFVSYQANGNGNYRLQSSSPAIDKGNPFMAPAFDVAGNKRIQGAAIDLGAYEFTPAANAAPSPTPAPTPVATPGREPASDSGSFSLSVNEVYFGYVPVGTTSVVKTVTLKNTGNTTFRISSAFEISGDFKSGLTGSCSLNTPYAPGESCTASVAFTPKALGRRLGSLTIQTSSSSVPRMLILSGFGK